MASVHISNTTRSTGRKDDVLVMGSGEKVVPLHQEGTIKSHHMVADAMMFGRGKNEPGVLIELRSEFQVDVDNETAVIEFRNLIWYALSALDMASRF